MTTAYAEPRFAPLPPTAWAKPKIDWKGITAKLAERPGQWAAVAEIGQRQSLGARAAKLRRHGVATTCRSNGDGTATVWACYVGTETASAPPRAGEGEPRVTDPATVARRLPSIWLHGQVRTSPAVA